ncbi:MAG: hypothetical protein K0V04_20415 [Deltaproteobacteria bacterium]|nr:hypothetical protein [Deltaproteobacteria bacterium]
MGTGNRTSAVRAVAALWAMLAAGCDALLLDAQLVERDTRAVTHATGALDGTPQFTLVGGYFAIGNNPPDAGDPDTVRRTSVTAVADRLQFTFDLFRCSARVDHDGDRTLSVDVRGCQILLWDYDIELEAQARIETVDCDTGTCAAAVVWDIDIADLASGVVGFNKVRYAGPVEVRAPLSPAEPMQWQTQPGFVVHSRLGPRFETLATTSWIRDDDECITVDMGARLTLEERADDLDERVGDVVLSVRGLQRCPGSCAHAGDVQLTFGTGQVLAWTYQGGGSILVTGPRGRELEVQLPCANEMNEGADDA